MTHPRLSPSHGLASPDSADSQPGREVEHCRLTPRRSDDRGMALLLALFFIGIGVIVVGVLMARMMQQRSTVAHYEDYNDAFLGLEAAISQSEVELENGDDGIIGMENWEPQWNEDNQLVLPDFDADGVTPQSLATMEDVQFVSYTAAWADDERDNNGNGLVDDASEEWMYTVYAMAKKGAALRKAEVVYKGDNVNVWQNAMFAGPGLSGGLINGSVNAHGSVHMLGDNLLSGVLGLATLGLAGTTSVRNGYQDIPNALRQRIPDPPQTVFEGETVATLGATFRARNGIISLSGGSQLGDAQATGNAVKETLDAVFVTGGWIGDLVTPDGDRGDPANVFSDNGWDELYDLADRVVFPALDGLFQDAQGGAQVTNPDTGEAYKHDEYFSQVLVGDSAVPDDGIYNGAMTIDTAGADFYWNATTGDQMSGSLPASAPPKTEDYLLFNTNKNLLEVNGQIVVNGKLDFKGKGTQKTIYYTGKGAILVHGNVVLGTDLLSCNNGDPSDLDQSFPVNNALGIMSSERITLGSSLLGILGGVLSGPDLQLMGAFYAADSIRALSHVDIAGTLVSNYFDLTLKPPAVYQVPSLGRNLPEGMVGDYPIMAVAQVSWRELGL